MVRRLGDVEKQKRFITSFNTTNLEVEFDKILGETAAWIRPEYQSKEVFKFPQHSAKGIRQMFYFRQILYQPSVIPEIRLMLHIQDLTGPNTHPALVADLAEGMLIIAGDLTKVEREQLLSAAEELLRAQAAKHVSNARILALLAEIYHLNARPASWVEKSARDALKSEPKNDLALLMLALSIVDDEETRKNVLNRLNEINPWIWPDGTEDEIRFQKGIFNIELQELKALGEW